MFKSTIHLTTTKNFDPNANAIVDITFATRILETPTGTITETVRTDDAMYENWLLIANSISSLSSTI